MLARVMEALCRLDIVGSPTNPNCAISFVAVASLVVFSCQNNWADSELICFVMATDICLYFFAWNHCFFCLLVLGFRGFACFCLQTCWRDCFWSDSVVVLERSFDLICFSSRRRVLRDLESGPSLACFFGDSLPVVPACFISLPALHICDRVCRILSGLDPVVVQSL